MSSDFVYSGPASTVEIARYAEVKQLNASLLDAYIPRNRRLTQLHFGRIVSNPDAPQAFSTSHGYNMTFNLVEPGKGNALHTHPAVEIFVAIDGEWDLAWGEKGENSVRLQPWDLIVVPAHVRHSYKNAADLTAHNIMTILPGSPAINWAPNVVDEARRHGAVCKNNGQLISFWNSSDATGGAEDGASPEHTIQQRPSPPPLADTDDEDEPPDAFHVPMSPADMLGHVRRYADGRQLCVEAAGSHLTITWQRLERGATLRLAAPADGAARPLDYLLVVLEGTVMLARTAATSAAEAAADAFAVAAPKDAVRVDGAEAGRIVVFNQLPAACTLLLVESQMRDLACARPHPPLQTSPPYASASASLCRRRAPSAFSSPCRGCPAAGGPPLRRVARGRGQDPGRVPPRQVPQEGMRMPLSYYLLVPSPCHDGRTRLADAFSASA